MVWDLEVLSFRKRELGRDWVFNFRLFFCLFGFSIEFFVYWFILGVF